MEWWDSVTVAGELRIPVVSTLGDDTGGGLFVLDGPQPRRIDNRATTGLASAPGRFVRALHTQSSSDGELLVYGGRGARSWLCLPELVDVHDVALDGDHFVCVSSTRNAIVWIDGSGTVVREHVVAAELDAWHVNCLYADRGRLWFVAFGRFERSRQWADDLDATTGVVVDLDSGETIARGLCCPHQARPWGDGLIVCNSRREELAVVDRSGEIVRRVALAGWTRGLAVAEDFVLVGESAARTSADGHRPTASIAVLDARTLEVRARIHVPDREVYEIALVAPTHIEALGRTSMPEGSGTGPAPTGVALPDGDRRVTITARVPDEVTAGSRIVVTCDVANRGSWPLASMLPFPVQIGYRWDGVEGPERTPLWGVVRPGCHTTVTLELPAPGAGEHTLTISAVQEYVAWFDVADPDSGWAAAVQVASA